MLYEIAIAIEKLKNINHDYSRIYHIEPIKLSTHKQKMEIVVYDKKELWILSINKNDIEKLYEMINKIECYKTQEEAFDEVKLILYKKDIAFKSPIKIEDMFVNDFKKLTLSLADETSLEYQYDKEKNRYSREKTPKQAEIMEVLYENLLGREVTRKALLEISQDPYLFKWLLELEDYECEDHYGLYSSVEEIALQIINELDKTGEILLEIAYSTGISYWVIYYLEARGEKEQLKKLIPLLSSITDKNNYLSLVEMFANQNIYEALESIKETMHIIKEKENNSYDFGKLIEARANLNDLSVIKKLIRMQHRLIHESYDESAKDIGELINKLTKHYGEMKILDQLQEDDKKSTVKEAYFSLLDSKDRRVGFWALQQYHYKYKEHDLLIERLNSSNWDGRNFIAKELIKNSHEHLNQILKDALESEEFSNKSKYWIVYILMTREEDVSYYIKKIQGIKIELPSFIGKKLRDKIVSYWYKETIAKTDIRWRIEGMELEKKTNSYNYKKSLLKIKKTLKKYNYRIKKSQDCAEKWQQGWSTYHILTIDTPQKESSKSLNSNCSVEVYDEIHISKVSNHAIYKECSIDFYKGEEQGNCNSYASTNKTKNRYFKNIIEEAGVNYLNKREGKFHLPKFNVYYAGKRIENLLFYWID